jgi:hypothetical protein
MSKDLGLGKRMPKYSIPKLVRLGYIDKVSSGGRGRSNHYRPRFESVKDWSPGWCGEKSETVHKHAPKTVHRCAPKTVHKHAPEPYPTNLIQGTTHEPTQPDRVCSSPSSPQKDEEPQNSEELTPEEIGEFIQLLTDKQAENPGAYRTDLENKLQKGKLTYSRKQLEELRGQNQPEQPPVEHQAQESEEHKEQKRQVSEALDRERDQGADQRDVIRRVLSGEIFQDSELAGIAEQQLQKEDPETYNAEKANYSFLNSARAAMRFPELAEKRVPGIIERLAKRDRGLADQLQAEWRDKKAELGLVEEAHMGLRPFTPATGA